MNFIQYPKERPPLPHAYRDIHEDEYLINRTSKNVANEIARKLEGWMHAKVAATALIDNETVLELGAGSLNHMPWEKKYSSYDVVEPFQKLLVTSKNLQLVHNTYTNLSDVPNKNIYDRVISVAVLEHMLDLPLEIALSGTHLEENGLFSAGIPSEGGWLWKMAWKYGTGIAYKRRTGLDYAVVMRHEHVNNASEIISCIRYFFNKVTVKRFPLPSKNLSLYTAIKATNVNKSRCECFIKLRSTPNEITGN
jgi:hypothetical protein